MSLSEHESVRVHRDAVSIEGIPVKKGETGAVISVLGGSPFLYTVELSRTPMPEIVVLREEDLWPDRWPEWDSPEWRAMMAESDRRSRYLREKYGFIVCPACRTGHTNKTIYCRECGYKVREKIGFIVCPACGATHDEKVVCCQKCSHEAEVKGED